MMDDADDKIVDVVARQRAYRRARITRELDADLTQKVGADDWQALADAIAGDEITREHATNFVTRFRQWHRHFIDSD